MAFLTPVKKHVPESYCVLVDLLNLLTSFSARQFFAHDFVLGIDVILVKDLEELFVDHNSRFNLINSALTGCQFCNCFLAALKFIFVLKEVLNILHFESFDFISQHCT